MVNRKFKAAIRRVFGARLKAVRKSRKLNVKTLSKAAHVSVNAIYTWERGDFAPSLDALYLLRAALDCSWGDLLGD